MTDYTETCGCGQPLHYTDPSVEEFTRSMVAKHGATIDMQVMGSRDKYKVPRHYLSLHGVAAAELPELAARYGWEKA